MKSYFVINCSTLGGLHFHSIRMDYDGTNDHKAIQEMYPKHGRFTVEEEKILAYNTLDGVISKIYDSNYSI